MNFSQAVERISQKVVSRGHAVERAAIESRLRRLVEEFSVPLDEAERTVTNELAREFSIPGLLPGGPGEPRTLDALAPGEWVTVECKVVALTAPPSPSVAQAGIVADQTAAVRFVAWSRANAPPLREGAWYRIESAVVDQYRGAPNLTITTGTTVTEIPEKGIIKPVLTPIASIRPGVVSVRGKMIQEWETTHERILQSGILADETGSVRFVTWKEEGRERLSPGVVYTIFYAVADEFGGRLSLTLNTATVVPEEGDIEVSVGDTSFEGALVHIAQGSGLIRRCPVEGCSRVLSPTNYCPVHEIQQNFQYDLRIKGWLDNGEETKEILIPRAATEALVGMTLDQAREIAENTPLGMTEIFLRFRDALLGRYFSCRGRDIDGRLLVSSCTPVRYRPERLADLLNRAGGS
ncbi:MAG: nucleotide-binding protein [Methanolinea sp.]|nr:nucleotide-binding protein [Methanolinea sp.]